MKRWEIYTLLTVLCLLVYANTLNNAFVSDDIADIVDNQFISRLWDFLLAPHNFLNSLIHMAGKLNPAGYHAVSILAHCAVTVLVYHFLRIFFRGPGSVLGACLFAVHPIHTEAVTWISGRPYVILALFVLGVFLLYERAGRCLRDGKADYRYYSAALAVFTYYVYNNYAFYAFFPLMLLIFDVTFERIRSSWRLLVPFFLILALRLLAVKASVATRAASVAKEMGGDTSWSNPLFNMTYSFFTHMGLLIWPAQLTLYHEPPVITVFWLRMGIIGLVVLFGLLIVMFRRVKPLFFAICVFGLFLAPTYSPVTISWLLAERYIYVPSLVLCIFLAYVYERWVDARTWQRLGLAIAIAVIAGYAVRTVARNEDWKTPNRFWRATAEVSMMSPRAHNNMGDVFAREGSFEGAIKEFKRAIELKPGYADPYHNLANIYDVLGNTDEAEKFYKQAIAINPAIYQSYRNLGNIYMRRGQNELAEQYFKVAMDQKSQEFARTFPGKAPDLPSPGN